MHHGMDDGKPIAYLTRRAVIDTVARDKRV